MSFNPVEVFLNGRLRSLASSLDRLQESDFLTPLGTNSSSLTPTPGELIHGMAYSLPGHISYFYLGRHVLTVEEREGKYILLFRNEEGEETSESIPDKAMDKSTGTSYGDLLVNSLTKAFPLSVELPDDYDFFENASVDDFVTLRLKEGEISEHTYRLPVSLLEDASLLAGKLSASQTYSVGKWEGDSREKRVLFDFLSHRRVSGSLADLVTLLTMLRRYGFDWHLRYYLRYLISRNDLPQLTSVLYGQETGLPTSLYFPGSLGTTVSLDGIRDRLLTYWRKNGSFLYP